MFKYLLIAFIVIVIAASAFLKFKPDNQEVLADKAGGYQFSYDKDLWQLAAKEELAKINQGKTGNDLKIQKALIHQDQINTTFGLIVQKTPGAKTFNRDKSIEQMDKDNQNRHNSFKRVKAVKIDFLGFPAIDYQFEYSVIAQIRSSETHFRERQIIFFAQEKIFRLFFSADREDYKTNQTNFETILKSFKLI